MNDSALNFEDAFAPRFWYTQIYGERYFRAEPEPAGLVSWEGFEPLLNGKRVGSGWSPPTYRIAGSRGWPDWMACRVPLWSERAVSELAPLVSDCCELVPWVNASGRKYSLVNVLSTISKHEWSAETSTIYGGVYASANVITVAAKQLPNMFRLEGFKGKTFVSDVLAQRSVASKLKGTAFVHPRLGEFEAIFRQARFGRAGTGFIPMVIQNLQ